MGYTKPVSNWKSPHIVTRVSCLEKYLHWQQRRLKKVKIEDLECFTDYKAKIHTSASRKRWLSIIPEQVIETTSRRSVLDETLLSFGPQSLLASVIVAPSSDLSHCGCSIDKVCMDCVISPKTAHFSQMSFKMSSIEKEGSKTTRNLRLAQKSSWCCLERCRFLRRNLNSGIKDFYNLSKNCSRLLIFL